MLIDTSRSSTFTCTNTSEGPIFHDIRLATLLQVFGNVLNHEGFAFVTRPLV